jgi:outer membrane protein OmpA-like peptidoglycan-associated protein
MRTKKIFLSAILTICIAVGVSAQTNTFYFMDEVPTRNSVNPAFIPNSAWYLDFIVLPSYYFEGGTNAFALKDFLMKKNNEWVTALHPSQDINKFYRRIPRTSEIGVNFGLNILNFGFRAKDKNYFTFDLSLKGSANAYIPKDLFKLALFGTPDETGINTYNLKNLGVNAAVYGELGLGYMRKINEKVNIGFKLKGLVGLAGAYTDIKKATLSASGREWVLGLQGDAYVVTPNIISYNAQDTSMNFNNEFYKTNKISDYVQGLGGAIDLGVTYEPIKNLVISAAVTDLGFIRWTKPQSQVRLSANGDFAFNGIEYKVGEDLDWQTIGDSIKNAFVNSVDWKIESGGKKLNQWLTANVNVGVEYGILKNKISFGALSNTRINQSRIMEEITLAVNFRPADWFKTYFSYTFFDGRYNNLGLGISFRMGCINTYLALDYIPLNWVQMSNSKNNTAAVPVPYGTSKYNIQAGMTFNFGRDSSDKDRDGVRNRKDKCPDTDIKALQALCPDVKRKDFVDKKGCTLDEDADGVPDCYDKCPNTPPNTPVDKNGCPFDEDGDGVFDHLDKCPNTPKGVQVDEHGCPLDEDGDGVPDYLDKCPNTPEGVKVDEHGCPLDTDGDGVPDYLDKCPDTPEGVEVDANGCPLDSDGDGVPDDRDKCPNTPKGVKVDENGCAPDKDGDGVPDYLDKCPDTPAAAYGHVDENGCPKDRDGDGVPDYIDRCPDLAGVAANYGCPEVKKEILKVFKQALNGIQFETGKATIKSSSNAILNQIVKIMQENPDFKLDIAGHTDNVGKSDFNLELSAKRAASVKEYLKKKGVEESRMSSEGYGDSRPVATNKTAAGRTQNRRVEFTAVFERKVLE